MTPYPDLPIPLGATVVHMPTGRSYTVAGAGARLLRESVTAVGSVSIRLVTRRLEAIPRPDEVNIDVILDHWRYGEHTFRQLIPPT